MAATTYIALLPSPLLVGLTKKHDRLTLLKKEREIQSLVSAVRRKKKKEGHPLPPFLDLSCENLTSFQRLCVYRIADLFGLADADGRLKGEGEGNGADAAVGADLGAREDSARGGSSPTPDEVPQCIPAAVPFNTIRYVRRRTSFSCARASARGCPSLPLFVACVFLGVIQPAKECREPIF